MILVIDAGNTRIKWAAYRQGDVVASAVCPTAEVSRLPELWSAIETPARIVVANVAGDAVKAALEQHTRQWGCTPQFIVSRGAQCGVRSSYEQPGQLGCDRWAALIGAHHLYPGASLVVNAGTAMTVDAMTEDGLFLGGIIAPGLELMRRALDQHTAQLRLQPGDVRFFPVNTGDAIMSGAAHALAGAIERMGMFLREAGQDAVRVILSGGGAQALRPLIALETIVVDNLVLQGLCVIAEEGA